MPCVPLEQDKFLCDGCPEKAAGTVDRCPPRWLFQHFGDKWTLPILGALHTGPLRFSQFRKKFRSLSERMLILTLNKLVGSNLVVRGKADSVSPHNAYMLTPLGRSLLEHIGDLHLWMGENAPALLAAYKASEVSQDKS